MAVWFHSFRSRLAFVFGGAAFVVGVVAMAYVYHAASERLTAASGGALTGIGRSIANVLATTLMEREREILLLSQRPMFRANDLPAMRQAIEQIRHSYRHYAWIGFADATGVVRAAGGGLLEGVKVDHRPWFSAAQQGFFVGDVHEAALLAKHIEVQHADEPLRFLDFAAPVRDPHGKLLGVVATHANWAWAGEVLASSLPADAAHKGIEAFILGRDGSVLYPYASIGSERIPASLPGVGRSAIIDWPGGEAFLTSQVRVDSLTATDLGWRVVVRQPAAGALQPVAELRRNIMWLGVVVTLVFVSLAYRLAGEFSEPVERLAAVAKGIRAGDGRVRFGVASQLREVQSLTESLQTMRETQLAYDQALQEANLTLEQKVQERTAALEAANRELQRLSRNDALTGLHNRLAANEALHGEFLRMKRSGKPYAVLLLDIDYFKRVNDTHGHEAGDAVLRHVAGILGAAVRATDFVARFGGEEFLILLPETTAGAAPMAEKIRLTLADTPVSVVGRVTASFGVAVADPADVDEDEAVRRADAALYRAKAEGRDRVVVA